MGFYHYTKLFFLIFSTILLAQTKYQTNYKPLNQLNQLLNDLAKSQQGKVFEIGKSRGNLAINVLQLGKDNQPAILIAAGFDGNHPAGVQTVWLLAQKLTQDPLFKEIIAQKTIYFLPVGNPDAYQAYFEQLIYPKRGNALKTDDNRNGLVGDDAYEDLNNDGYITMMRVEDATGDYLEHSEEGRIIIKADASKQQQGKYLLFSEGIDNNQDGNLNEDASEGVNIDANFAFDYQIFKKGHGEFAASEPETRAIMNFVMEKPNIHSVISFGLQDNLLEAVAYDAKKAKERIIKSWQENDAKVSKQISELYQKTKLEAQEKLPLLSGSFSQTMYYHAGKYSFVTPGWYPIIPKDSTEQKSANKALTYEQKFLKWADKENLSQVFLPWQSIKHPDFPNQKVDVGGFLPYALWNPPLQYLENHAEVHKEFVLNYLNLLPKVEIVNPKVEKLDNNLYRVTVSTVNKGFLPTSTAIGHRIRFVDKLKIEIGLTKSQSRLSGQKYYLNEPLAPNESVESSWLVNGSGKVTITAGNATSGVVSLTLDLK